MTRQRILIVRLSSMGDVIHTLPSAASLRRSFPDAHISWLIRPRWAPLLDGNPHVDEVITLERSFSAALACARRLRYKRFDLAVDFQGLIQTGLVAASVRPKVLVGYGRGSLREKAAEIFYHVTAEATAAHVVDRNLELAAAAGAAEFDRSFPLPDGKPEGELPRGRFVLASPLAGWGSKQWPIEFWSQLAKLLDLPLVVNGPPSAAGLLAQITGAHVHVSGIHGLIHATRKAHSIVGLDSGPMHLAAALSKPGVAIFGPTDPARNGPYGGSLRVLRAADAVTDYHRSARATKSMAAITPKMVADALMASATAGCRS
jgi:heptosyltransferase-1